MSQYSIARCFWWLSVGLILTICYQPAAASNDHAIEPEDQDMQAVKQAADQIISRFHATLDVRQSLSPSDTIGMVRRLGRKRIADLLNLSAELAGQTDEKILDEAYVEFMTFAYVRATYNASRKLNKDQEEDRIPLPKDVKTALHESTYLRPLVLDDDAPVISTINELRKYMRELGRASNLYRNHLTAKVFLSQTYKENIKAREGSRRAIETQFGSDYLSIPDTTKVYVVHRDLFTMYFVVLNRKPQIAGFGFDN